MSNIFSAQTVITAPKKAPKGGSSDLEWKMTTAQHADFLTYIGSSDTPTTNPFVWVNPFENLAGGTLSLSRDVTTIYDEANTDLGDTVDRNEFTIANGAMNSTAYVIKALEWMESNFCPVRYALPLQSDGVFETGTGGNFIGQIWGFYRARARRTDRSIGTARDTQRAMEFEIVASLEPGQSRIYEVWDGDITDEANWPTFLNDFKST